MSKTIYKSVGSVRRSPVPRRTRTSAGGLTGAFETLLAKLSFASGKLEQSRPRRRR